MTGRTASLALAGHRSFSLRTALVLLLLVGSVGGGYGVAHPALERLTVALALVALLGAIAVVSPRNGLLALATWLVALGTVRRLAPGNDLSGLGDPLLLVGPALLVVLVLASPGQRRPLRASMLTYAVLAFQVLAVLSALNPLQGGLQVGLAGLLFVPAPMLGFWVGRATDERSMARLLRFLALLAVPVALYGLWQTLVGFPPWDQRWISSVMANYMALNVGGEVRAFSSLSSAAEYAFLLGIGIVVLVAGLRRTESAVPSLALLALLAVSVLLESSRGIVVTAALALGLMAAARLGWTRMRALTAGVVMAASLPFVVGLATPQNLGTGFISGLLAHQLQGLANPFGAASTLPLHIAILMNGLRSSLSAPLGLGVGAVSIAASHFGGVTAGTEVDPGNAAVALGIPGLALYLLIAAAGLWRAYELARSRRDFLSVTLLGVLLVTALQWFNGGQYAVAWLVWLAFGAVDAASAVERDVASTVPTRSVATATVRSAVPHGSASVAH
jgi:hypothetical protein